jgi:nicotinamide-nucleotide amidase
MNVCIVTIGDELLIGQVIDTNSARMAQYLHQIGGQVIERIVVGDSLDAILGAFRTALDKAEVVLVTGGLGPTKDDITKNALAKFYETGFVFHQETHERIVAMLERFGRPVTESLRDQCWMPQNAMILTNKMGTAPGMWFDEKGKVLVAMPGVPFEMEYLMEHEVTPRLKTRFPGKPIAHRTLLTVGEGESQIAEKLRSFEETLPPLLKLAYLPGVGQVRLRLTASDNDEAAMTALLEEKFAEMQSLLPQEIIAGFEKDTLEIALGKRLKEKGLTLSTAESCTGGYVAHLITSVPGSSNYFAGSVISYANEVKMRQLGVKEDTLKQHGAVSEPTVREMVAGALNLLKTDIAVATSGIAGPDGGTPEKPVGTIWVAVGNRDRIETRMLRLGKDRMRNIQYTAIVALNQVRLFVREL